MNIDRKIQLGIALYPIELEALTAIAEEKHISRSALVNNAIKACVERPGLFGAVVYQLMTEESTLTLSTASIRKENTSVLVNGSYVDRLDDIADKLTLSRNALLGVISKGITHRAI